MIIVKKLIIVLAIILFLFTNKTFLLYADDTPTPIPSSTPSVTPAPTPDNSQEAHDLQSKIADLENKISDLQGQEKTLSSQIEVMDSQVKLTEYRIEAIKQQILSLEEDIDTTTKKISNLENSLADLTKVLMNRIVTGYEVGSSTGFQTLLASNTITDYFKRANYLKLVEQHDRVLVYSTVQAKNDYANEKRIFEDKKKRVVALEAQLVDYTKQLHDEEKQKQDLLTETQGSEINYQRQLAQYKAQLASLSNFAVSRAGTQGSILPHSEQSDGWGKYYNQRDANWGNNRIGLSGEHIWEVGCLLTSYAMVSSHFGAGTTPGDIAGNNDNFALGTAYFKLPGPDANGHSVEYQSNPSISQLRDIVKSGTPVIAGLSVNGGPFPQHYSDHWVVLRSVHDDGSFQINDPWYPGAMNVNINDNYAGWTIIEARIYR